MIDINGRLIRVGDRIDIGFEQKGVVVFCLDTDEFRSDYVKANWEHLKSGIMVERDDGVLFFFDAPDEHTEVIG